MRPGLSTTVQDLGRFGFAWLGVPPAGAADALSAALANRLVGNAKGEAVLEMTASGAELEILGDLWLAAAGADMPAVRGGASFALGRPHRCREGDLVEFGMARHGLRTYLAVAGGIDVPMVLGSRSTHLAAGIGGLKGRRLQAGDILDALPHRSAAASGLEGTEPVGAAIPESPFRLRALPGPQADSFSEEATRRFYASSFRVSPRSDRMGLRLEGEKILSGGPREIVTEGAPPGAVQVPGGGDPIVLMPEGPVTGGYPKIACVIGADLRLIGQIRPGDVVRFQPASEEEALAARRQEGTFLRRRERS